MLQHARRLPQQLVLRLLSLEPLAAAPTCVAGASFATKAAAPQSSTQAPAVSKPSKGVTVYKKTDWKALAAQLPKHTVQEVPTVTEYGQAFIGDLRSTSGLGLGDGLTSHTAKWLQASTAAANRGCYHQPQWHMRACKCCQRVQCLGAEQCCV